MILIWGFRARAKKIGQGTFFCPKCGADRMYLLQQIRRWFTLFFIPLVPTGKPLGEVVKCTTCGTTYRPEVLNTPTSATMTESMRTAMRIAVVAIVKAGAPTDATTRRAAVAMIRDAGVDDYDDALLAGDLEHGDLSALPAYLTPLADGLNVHGKEAFVTKVATVGLADGPLTPSERAVIDGLGGAFGLSAAYVTGIVDTASAATVRDAVGPHDFPPDTRS